ncbi:MAG: MgtC/SapB family protein [Gammaproteobacteria bacterium]
MDSGVLGTLSLALGLGLLIGLQRQRAGSAVGGIRTFPLIALLGAMCGLLASVWSELIVVAGFIGITTMAVLANLAKNKEGAATGGQTTEVAALLTYILGAFLATKNYPVAIVVGGVIAVLLHFKEPMHQFAGRMSERDVQAVMRFVIISLIILPVLPDKAFGPYQVLNPREIWLMVVLIVGIGLAGYVSYKLFGEQAGIVLGGILGGLISSTATTVAYARRIKDNPAAASLAAITIVIASSVAAARVIVEVAVVAPNILGAVAPPLGALCLLMVMISIAMLLFDKTRGDAMPEQGNPAELKSALLFGAIYALIVFATAAVKERFGGQALYVIAVISGVVDVDAITLSTAQLAAAERVDTTTTWQVILIASLVNLVFKAGVALMLGSAKLFLRVALAFGVAIAGGVLILLAWPR